MLAKSCEKNECDTKTDCACNGIIEGHKQCIVLLNHRDCHTKYGTVGSDKRKEYAESLI